MSDSDVLPSSASTVNAMSYRQPSLILSPSKVDHQQQQHHRHPHSQHSDAIENQWLVNGVGQLELSANQGPSPGPLSRPSVTTADNIDENNNNNNNIPRDSSSSTTSSVSHSDDIVMPQSSHHPPHSRDSSTTSTTSVSQNLDTPSNNNIRGAFNAPLSPDIMIGNMSSERPHSFSGGLSQSDLRRLQNLPTKGQPPSPIATFSRLDGPRTSPPRENIPDGWADGKSAVNTPPRFPTLVDQPTAFPSIQASANDFANPIGPSADSPNALLRNDFLNLSDDYQMQPRGIPSPGPLYDISRLPESQYRLPLRTAVPTSYAPHQPAQPLLQASSPYIYPSQARPPPLDRSFAHTQQPYYDMLNTQQSNMRREPQLMAPRGTSIPPSPPIFSPGAPPTATLDNTIRNPASLAMHNGVTGLSPYVSMGMPTSASGIYTSSPNSSSPIAASFPGFPAPNPQYYPHTPPFNGTDALTNAMGRMNLGGLPPNGISNTYADGESASSNQTGPSTNNRKLGLYKTELCRSWEEKGSCRYGAKCQFAHSMTEVRRVSRHPKYKTEICRTFWVSGSCPYGKRCCFIHTELPASGTPPGADGSSPPKLSSEIRADGGPTNNANRGRSLSNSSSGENQPISLLQRISAQRESILSPVDQMSPGGYPFPKPTANSLRLDTSALPGKTSYPLTSNPTLTSSENQGNGMSPVLPATAGPDFGRQAAARVEIVGYNGGSQRGLVQGTKSSGRDSQLRHSFNGTEMGLSINSPVLNTGLNSSLNLPPATPDSANAQTPTGSGGHQRAGSAGQWPTGGLNSHNGGGTHLTSPSSFIPHHASTNERSSPWGLSGSDLSNSSPNRKRLSGTWL